MSAIKDSKTERLYVSGGSWKNVSRNACSARTITIPGNSFLDQSKNCFLIVFSLIGPPQTKTNGTSFLLNTRLFSNRFRTSLSRDVPAAGAYCELLWRLLL